MKRLFVILLLSACAHTQKTPLPALSPNPPTLTLDRDSQIPLYDGGPDREQALVKLWQEFQNNFPPQTKSDAFGDVWYRGRWQANAAQVLVIGESKEAQDLISRRAFSGGYGAELQNLLGQWSIHKSYLFLNLWPWQSPQSHNPSVLEWQKRLLAQAISQNQESLAAILAVGSEAKAAISALLQESGIPCPAQRNLALCQTEAIAKKFSLRKPLYLSGITAPQAMDASFAAGLKITNANWREFAQKHPAWLQPDTAETPAGIPNADLNFQSAPFTYVSQSSKQIQVALRKHYLSPAQTALVDARFDQSNPLPGLEKVRYGNTHLTDFDEGPCLKGNSCALAQLLRQANILYRGNFQNAQTLVLSSYRSADDILIGRALVGKLGQKLQSFLQAAARDENYFMLSCPENPAKGLFDKILWESFPLQKPNLVIILGECPAYKENQWSKGVLSIRLALPRENTYTSAWNEALMKLQTANQTAPKGYDDRDAPIPRKDLPFGWPEWAAASGDHVAATPSYLTLRLPLWVETNE